MTYEDAASRCWLEVDLDVIRDKKRLEKLEEQEG